MNIHEYQAKELLAKWGVPIPKGIAAFSVEEAVEASKQLPGPLYVVKAQIHSGARGKAGGIRLCANDTEISDAAEFMLGRKLVITKHGSANTVVWNPWVDKSAAMPDFGDDEWIGMICIEAANALGDAITLRPGETHTLKQRITLG